ncbi:DNA mismatch repair endonuclease MutL [Halopenitus persicus]|uniref:DNA mismatch repair protein MutL n=1 Tax=Halopenitus persicus TaxID=1048396 RepID=A0A1H3IEM7_9EURY|nr:DNA mismatch repair endonuclease MutL [Halopenitus persicus]SDY26313.1 DNA mismatch repair protein MutL [Halopenitus persicus]
MDEGERETEPDGGPETSSIRHLDERTVQRIAAGEVVERPASVVKELVENALDAGADRISVSVTDGGTSRIRVRDDGVGIPPAQLPDAVAEHATSKIADIEDLDSGVGTLGFRGEALYTIGAVSRLTVRSRPRPDAHDPTAAREAEQTGVDLPPDAGAELTVEGGEVGDVRPAGCPVGTTVEVADLFFNTPARRKFLKTDATEFDHVNRVVTQYALANPDVAVSLEHDGRETFATQGNGDLESAVLAVYGRDVARSMITVDYAIEDDETGPERAEIPADTPVERVYGLVSHPETTRANREYLSTFVNDRYVTASTLRNAVVDAYGGQLAPDRYPFAVLFVELPAGTVDVNVHPRKLEVKYNKPEAVKRTVRTVIENALREEGILRSSAPRGRSAPDETSIDPVTLDDTVELTPDDTAASTTDDKPDQTSEDIPDLSTADSTTETVTGPDAWSVQTSNSTQSTSPSSGSTPTNTTEESTSSNLASQSEIQSEPESNVSNADFQGAETPDSEVTEIPSQGHQSRSPAVTEPNTQTTLGGDDATPETQYENFPDIRVMGQLHNTYIVAESDDGLLLIDQHAADERVNYERLQERFDGDTTAQELAEPVEVELTAREAAAFDDFSDALARLGFYADRVDDRIVEVSTVPALLAEAAGPELVRDVLVDLVADGTDTDQTVESIADGLLADMACHPSITGNTSLTEGSVVDLLSALDDCDNPWSCPHGRPVVIHIDSDEIGDRFERDYPGH